jgi:hypothetical protein
MSRLRPENAVGLCKWLQKILIENHIKILPGETRGSSRILHLFPKPNLWQTMDKFPKVFQWLFSIKFSHNFLKLPGRHHR